MAMTTVAGVIAGTVDNEVHFTLRSTANNAEVTGKVAADMTIYYRRPGSAPVQITPSNLGSITAAHSDGGVVEWSATNQPGKYRLDLPDLAIAAGVPWCGVTVKVVGCWLEELHIPLSPIALPWSFPTGVLDSIFGAVWKGDMATLTSEATRSPLKGIRRLVNKWGVSGTTLTVYKEDDATVSSTETLTSSGAATPITGADPT